MDGFESARHNHGYYSWAWQFWFKPGEDHVAKASIKGKSVAAESLGCSSQYYSGEEERSLAKKRNQQSQYDQIVHQDAKGERLLYCDTVIEMIRKQYPNHELALSYDVICKEVAHLQQPYMLQTNIKTPFIAVLAAMHAQAHCQVKFSPRIIAGLGTKLDGEGVERENAWLARSIGLTVGETEGNWELDISLIAEDYNCSKLQSALKIISRKLDLAYVDLASIESAIGEPTNLNRGTYAGFIVENSTWQGNLLKDHYCRKSVGTSVEDEIWRFTTLPAENHTSIAI
ncbi:hypothetical protein CcCBS67573_g09971 [Chytriomyces confervae]|uniref:Uncharacterized protein n=1 Tax=Chytriomyces confervae TaxID=246404 RepID=A0A507DJU6_9FUNG|nr:hypothetical protein CcCBS67573_g09971 [Chytriomyces confervae]